MALKGEKTQLCSPQFYLFQDHTWEKILDDNLLYALDIRKHQMELGQGAHSFSSSFKYKRLEYKYFKKILKQYHDVGNIAIYHSIILE
jgi:hypothetical protein